MTIENTDVLLVNRGGISHKIKYETLKQDISTGTGTGGVPEAPNDGTQYGRQDNMGVMDWTPIVVPPAYGDTEVNALLNQDQANGGQILSWEGSDYQWVDLDTTTPNTIEYKYPGGISRTAQNRLEDRVSPRDFGAKGDGATDDRVAIQAALDSGKIVDGGGYTYAVDGAIRPNNIQGLVNCNIKQIGDNSNRNIRTLDLETHSDYFVENVSINMGDNEYTLFSNDGNSGIYCGALPGGYAENISLVNIRVTGNGCGSGIQVRHSKRVTIVDCSVRDRISDGPINNDSQDGFTFLDCANLEIVGCAVYNLRSRINGVLQNKWTRGFLFASCRDFVLSGCTSISNDQGYDFSGGAEPQGNKRFTVSGCVASNNGTFGFKFANVAQDGLVTGCIANNVSACGFVCSGSKDTTLPDEYRTQRMTFVGCKVVNILGDSWNTAFTKAGFYVDDDNTGYPKDVKFEGCSVVDNQATPKTDYGFVTNIAPTPVDRFEFGVNDTVSCRNCSVRGVRTAYSGIHWASAYMRGADAGQVSNEVWTRVDWKGKQYDPSGMHVPGAPAQKMNIKEPGLYYVSSTVAFNPQSSTKGDRHIRVTVNDIGTDLEGVYATNNENSYLDVTVFGTVYCEEGDFVSIEIWQNSGTNAIYDRGRSQVSIHRVA